MRCVTTDDEHRRDSLADRESRNARTDCENASDDIVAGDDRRLVSRIETESEDHVGERDAARFNADE